MDNICKHNKFGYCKFKESCKKHHVIEECTNGMTCRELISCQLRHPKMCRRLAMEGYCRLGKECAYNHRLLLKSNNEDTELLHESIKNMKTEIDVLKYKVNSLVVTKEESEILKKDVEYIKEEINILRAAKKKTADKIIQIENDFEYDTEEEDKTTKR